MYAVVNRVRFELPIPDGLFEWADVEIGAAMRAVPGFGGMTIVRVSDTEAILIILGDSPATLDHIANEIGSPWMMANVVPLMSGPPERIVGEVAARVPPAF